MGFQSTSELVGGGRLYAPPMCQFNGTTQYFTNSVFTTTGNGFTAVMRFKLASFTGDTDVRPLAITGTGGVRWVCLLRIWSNDYTIDTALRDRMTLYISDNTGTIIAHVVTKIPVTTDEEFTVFISFAGASGTLLFIVNGKDSDDTTWANRVAPSPGTLDQGINCRIGVGATSDGTKFFPGSIGFVGYDDVVLSNWEDFITADGRPKPLDESGWTEWGGQPIFWQAGGQMDVHLGSGPLLTNMNNVRAGDGGSYPPHRGIATIGDAAAANIEAGYVAWVNAQRIVGSAVVSVPGLLFFHQFDGAVSTNLEDLVPQYDVTGRGSAIWSQTGSPGNVYLDGNGFLTSNGGYSAFIDPLALWPSRVGKTRCYRVWGKVITPVATSYFPTMQINYLDGSNFWSCRSMYNGNVYAQTYEWIAGAVGEGVRQSTAVFAASGEYYFDMTVRDFGDTVSMTLTGVDESSKTSDLTVGEPNTLQLYKATRPNQSIGKLTFSKWEVPSGWTNHYIRGFMVWDE